MKLYSYITPDGPEYETNKTDAVILARKAANHHGVPVTVVKREVTRAHTPAGLAVALLTNKGWCAKSEDVVTVTPRRTSGPGSIKGGSDAAG